MKRNLGKLDRIFRFAFGIWAISWLLPIIQNEALWWFVLIVGIIGIVEGFIPYCGLNTLLGIDNRDQ